MHLLSTDNRSSMEFFRLVIRFLYRIRWYLAIPSMIAVIATWFLTRGEERCYEVATTIYVGVISNTPQTDKTAKEAECNISNLILLANTEKTMQHVSMRLLARCLMYGDEERDNNFIFAEHYRKLVAEMPKEVLSLIDRDDEQQTVANLTAYATPQKPHNYICRLLSDHPFFGTSNILKRLRAKKVDNSDMLHISYSCSDAGIAFNTLEILNEELICQYDELRLGETNFVIKFYEEEVNRLYALLRKAEGDPMVYDVTQGVLGNVDEMPHVSFTDDNRQLGDKELLLNSMSQRAAIDWIENRLGAHARTVRDHADFDACLQGIAHFASRICQLTLLQEGVEGATEENLQDAQTELQKAEQDTRNVCMNIAATTGRLTNEKRELFERWVGLVIEQEESLARMKTMDGMRKKLEEESYYRQETATEDLKAYHLRFMEQSYLDMIKALNDARIRQHELRLSTATLRIIDPPAFPIKSSRSQRPLLLLLVFIGTMAAVALLLFLVGLLDHTLRDRRRTERLTKLPVIGCYPKEDIMHHRKYARITGDMALRQLSKQLLSCLDTTQLNVVNLISTSEGNGKSFIANELCDLWSTFGLTVHRLCYNEDFYTDERRYIMARSIHDLCPHLQPGEVLIVEYPALNDYEVPRSLINAGTINLLVTRANRTWKDIDQKTLSQLQSIMQHPESLFIYLTEAGRDAVEEFVGQLPPYTPFRNFVYRMSQLGFTATENNVPS
ncbi:MAG: hypothetical protein KBT12_02035 [Bacteroidales bacterium]|nr:hypothetical protein [Candidatus Physcousia equi]